MSDQPERCPNPQCRSYHKNIRGDGCGFPCVDPWHTSVPPEPTRVRSSVIDSEGRIRPYAPAPASAPPASPATQSAEQSLTNAINGELSSLREWANRAEKQNARLRAELEELRAAVQKYGRHDLMCNVRQVRVVNGKHIHGKCGCGFEAVLGEVKQIKICENPDCPSPQFTQQRRGQKYCTHKCAVLMNVRRFRARLSNKKESQ